MSVSRTVSEIFSVKEWRDIETGGRGRSRSLKMAPFDRSYTTFCQSVIVSINTNKKLSCRRETARRFVSLNILLSHSRSLNVIRMTLLS